MPRLVSQFRILPILFVRIRDSAAYKYLRGKEVGYRRAQLNKRTVLKCFYAKFSGVACGHNSYR